MKIAIIGAGLSGSVLAETLKKQGHDITVVEKSRGRGGRMNTKRLHWANCDMGAQYFTARDHDFKLKIREWTELGLVGEWQVSPHSLKDSRFTSSPDNENRYVALPEMNSITKHLLQGVDLELNTRVNHLTKDDDKWLLWRDNMDLIGIFDWVISCIPAEQAKELLVDFPTISEQIPKEVHAPCWAVSIATKGIVKSSFNALFSDQNISWVARQNSKPARELTMSADTKFDDVWNLHVNEAFSKTNSTADAHTVTQLAFDWLRDLLVNQGLTQELKLVDSYAHFWRYARPSQAFVKSKSVSGTIVDPNLKLAVIGDWTMGGRVEGAFVSAKACAEVICR